MAIRSSADSTGLTDSASTRECSTSRIVRTIASSRSRRAVGRGFWILLAGLLWAARPASYQSPDLATIEALAARPEQFADPQLRLKIFRALEGPSADVVAAAVDIVMSSPELAADPQLWRRVNAALLNAAPGRRGASVDTGPQKGPIGGVPVLDVPS